MTAEFNGGKVTRHWPPLFYRLLAASVWRRQEVGRVRVPGHYWRGAAVEGSMVTRGRCVTLIPKLRLILERTTGHFARGLFSLSRVPIRWWDDENWSMALEWPLWVCPSSLILLLGALMAVISEQYGTSIKYKGRNYRVRSLQGQETTQKLASEFLETFIRQVTGFTPSPSTLSDVYSPIHLSIKKRIQRYESRVFEIKSIPGQYQR